MDPIRDLDSIAIKNVEIDDRRFSHNSVLINSDVEMITTQFIDSLMLNDGSRVYLDPSS